MLMEQRDPATQKEGAAAMGVGRAGPKSHTPPARVDDDVTTEGLSGPQNGQMAAQQPHVWRVATHFSNTLGRDPLHATSPHSVYQCAV